ncbi:adenylyltransferase/cytidyltransferase family protein [Vagococcus lutrae]|uniref:adenylyltransferase/cytidyltransferase family protein n=1 Tax=Vagococcus lutrae TaxID=81947 RepID=UPI0023A9A0D4|nr:adenylyltransferase/cytidyltransferase family protein [Vagococcus lutrae]WEB81766.1 adenylyltransferase/cytidyltransferase family protein [Vagococcus lutrae]
MTNKVIGYTAGTFDMFHIGHLNLLKEAKKKCDILIVGVNSDKLVKQYKNKQPIINENCRSEIVKAIKYVDQVAIMSSLDKVKAFETFQFNKIFIGSDWVGHPRWKKTEEDLKPLGASVVYIDYTEGVSSTKIVSDIICKEKRIEI